VDYSIINLSFYTWCDFSSITNRFEHIKSQQCWGTKAHIGRDSTKPSKKNWKQ